MTPPTGQSTQQLLDSLEFTAPVKCYNGAFDSKSQQVLDAQDEVLRLVQQKEPRAHVTYFPGEEEFVVHVLGRQLSAYHKTRGAALADAFRRLGLEEGAPLPCTSP